jgi:UPF0755 protein
VGIIAWLFFGAATGFEGKMKYLYIPTKEANKQKVLELLEKDSFVTHTGTFNWLADKLDYWQQIKPGKYRIESGNSVVHILRMLKNGHQEPAHLIITKIRTKEDLASQVGKRFECDSAAFMEFLLNRDTLSKYGLDSNTVMSAVFPDTYTYYWNTTPSKIFHKLYRQYQAFWTDERKALAKERRLTQQSAYTLASIVEEETNQNDEKGNIASVYLNRLNKGMRLGADPTVKYALRDFGLKRIYQKHLAVESPYNTYKVLGLPPGPICTPSAVTIDAVLNSPKTDYIYFVAKSDFSGHHQFATSYEEHLKYAKAYRDALDTMMKRKALNND